MNFRFPECCLLCIDTDAFSLHLFPHREDYESLYKGAPGHNLVTEYKDCKGWLWGFWTEPYDLYMSCFGLGPLAVVWWLN